VTGKPEWTRADILRAEAAARAKIPARGARMDVLLEQSARRVAVMTETEAKRIGRVVARSADGLQKRLARTPGRTFTASALYSDTNTMKNAVSDTGGSVFMPAATATVSWIMSPESYTT
jgi:hypothetical protein